MSYLAFDMDGTLGSFTILKRLLCIFNQPAFFIKTPEKAAKPDEALNRIIGVSYSNFVRRILEQEQSERPLGLFRPGIFDLFKQIHKLRQEGAIKGVIIYSNNQTESLVNFVKDVINIATGSGVIDACFFRFSRSRLPINVRIANPEKTWAEIIQLLGSPEGLAPKDVIFFDDLVHADLKKNLGANYINVEEYIHNPPLIEVLEVYRKALIEDNKDFAVNEKEILSYIKSCSYDAEMASFNDYLTAILSAKATGNYKRKGTGPIPINDKRSSKYMLASLNAILKKGGGRKARKTRRRSNL